MATPNKTQDQPADPFKDVREEAARNAEVDETNRSTGKVDEPQAEEKAKRAPRKASKTEATEEEVAARVAGETPVREDKEDNEE